MEKRLAIKESIELITELLYELRPYRKIEISIREDRISCTNDEKDGKISVNIFDFETQNCPICNSIMHEGEKFECDLCGFETNNIKNIESTRKAIEKFNELK